MKLLDLWHTKFDFETIRRNAKIPEVKHLVSETISKSGKGNHDSIFYKITTNLLGKYEINEQPPLVYHPFEIKKEHEMILTFIDHYAETLQDNRRCLIKQYEVEDVALKVVVVGIVGTRCYVVLLMKNTQENCFFRLKKPAQVCWSHLPVRVSTHITASGWLKGNGW